jgi:methylated-DNA-[protein]-cysteine S-methyltransferase
MTEIHTYIDSPVGELLLAGDGEVLSRLAFVQRRRPEVAAALRGSRADDAFAAARAQLAEYFAGERRDFDLPLALHGSDFELRVWDALRRIPYGATTSYGALARAIGHPDAARAVGLANGRNPVAVIVPCHRVIGADGSLTGYGGGLHRKRFLLDLEAGRTSLLGAPAASLAAG